MRRTTTACRRAGSTALVGVLPLSACANEAAFVPRQENVHGIVPSSETLMLFGDAWIDQ